MSYQSHFITCNNVKTAYIDEGKGQAVVLLHGWGQNKEMMVHITNHLVSGYRVVALDFPGHGESEDPKEAWGVEEYRKHLEAFFQALSIDNPILIAHSFGCRVAIRYAALFPVKKMLLTGAAGLKPKHGIDYHIRTFAYKLGKKFLLLTNQKDKLKALQQNAGSSDYRNAKGIMKPTFVKVVNDDVKPLLKNITCPVLLVWGEFDDAVPLAMGKEMEQMMPNAALAVFKGDDHWAYYHQKDRFNAVIDAFLGEE